MSSPFIECDLSNEFAQLIERVRSGDDSAMTQISEKYGPAMRRTAREMIGHSLRSHLDSEDLVQSVQLMLWLGLRTGKFTAESPENLLALATTLLKRKVSRYCRNSKMQLNRTINCSFDDTWIDAVIYPTEAERDPQKITEFDDLVEHFISQLGELDRRVITLRLEGYSTADVARHLNVDAGLLRVRLGRLRTRFADFQEFLAQSPAQMPPDEN